MQKRTKEIIEELAQKLIHLEQPIHLLAICSGGTMVAKIITSYLSEKGIEAEYYEVWTNIINGKSELWKTNFTKENYTGTAVIIEDVIWKGRQLPPIKKMLKKMNSRKKFYLASLLDCNNKADFSVFK
jgi:hypoxanthine-guanine phosphoribosyltransferase